MDDQPAAPPIPPNRCFLSPLDTHHHLLVDLKKSVVFQPLRQQGLRLPDLLQLLVSRYGGSPSNWSIRNVSTAFVVQITDWIFGDDIHLDSDFWILFHMAILPWQTLDGSVPTNPRGRLIITIHDFPLDFSHPHYLRQAITSIGVLLGFATGNMNRGNLARIKLLMETFHEGFVPLSIYVFHAGKLSICPITTDGWEHPPPPPPTLIFLPITTKMVTYHPTMFTLTPRCPLYSAVEMA